MVSTKKKGERKIKNQIEHLKLVSWCLNIEPQELSPSFSTIQHLLFRLNEDQLHLIFLITDNLDT